MNDKYGVIFSKKAFMGVLEGLRRFSKPLIVNSSPLHFFFTKANFVHEFLIMHNFASGCVPRDMKIEILLLP